MPRDLPSRTAALAQAHAGKSPNLGLVLNKLGLSPLDLQGGGAKGRWLAALASETHVDPALLRAHLARWQAIAAEYQAAPVRMVTASRLIVGLGGESVLETSITLHPLYGYPTIPGSALKGLTRSYVLVEVAQVLGVPILPPEPYAARKAERGDSRTPLDKLEALLEMDWKADERSAARALEGLGDDPLLPANAAIRALALKDLGRDAHVYTFRTMFGHLGHVGDLLFFDAVPERVKLAVDIINPHYPQYYQDELGHKGTAPHDAQQPIPVPFLAVDKDVPFWFAVGARRAVAHGAERAAGGCDWLVEALQRAGVGGKTAAGYGLFRLAPVKKAGAP